MSGTALAVIPARGGSRGVPGKNIRLLGGRPLIAWTIEQARLSRRLDRVVVSTEDSAIAEVARKEGAEVIMRPREYSTDEAPPELAVMHAVEELGRSGYEPDIIVTLQPTSPLREPATIDRCIQLLETSGADSVITVVETRECFGTLDPRGHFSYLFPGQPRRRQARTPLYRESSTVYATRVGTLISRRSVLGERIFAVAIPEEEGVDINIAWDFTLAEALMSARSGDLSR